MSDTLPIWKQAAKDPEHPLHNATWLLFSQKFNVKRAAKQLEAQKEAVIDYMLQILDEVDLQMPQSFGSGNAPVHSVELLGYWRVTDAIPRLIQILEDDPSIDYILTDKAISAIERMGAAAIDPLLDYIERNPEEKTVTSLTLAHVGYKNERVYEYIQEYFETLPLNTGPFGDAITVAEALASCDSEKAVPYLRERLKTNRKKLTQDGRKRLENIISEAEGGFFDDYWAKNA